MDNVRAVTNIKEGLIELEGPREFVDKYLDIYNHLLVTGNVVTHKLDKNTENREKQHSKRTRVVRPKSGPSCQEKVRQLIGEGFFKEQRSREDVQQKLIEKGVRYESKNISASLINLYNGGKLERTGVGKNAKYYTNI